MTPEFAVTIVRETLWTAFLLGAPMLFAGLIAGVTISILQSATQIQEMTLTFIPKIIVVVGVMIFMMPWMINTLLKFTLMIYGYIGQMSY
ncbi:flagellar biosynthesis protein FliQ [bacterium]|nr:flagellar biosynthesis protein FliQ [bacterium]